MHRDDFAHDKPPSRGQWKAIAEAYLSINDEPAPTTRAEATTLLARLDAFIASSPHVGGDILAFPGGSRGGPDGGLPSPPGPDEVA